MASSENGNEQNDRAKKASIAFLYGFPYRLTNRQKTYHLSDDFNNKLARHPHWKIFEELKLPEDYKLHDSGEGMGKLAFDFSSLDTIQLGSQGIRRYLLKKEHNLIVRREKIAMEDLPERPAAEDIECTVLVSVYEEFGIAFLTLNICSDDFDVDDLIAISQSADGRNENYFPRNNFSKRLIVSLGETDEERRRSGEIVSIRHAAYKLIRFFAGVYFGNTYRVPKYIVQNNKTWQKNYLKSGKFLANDFEKPFDFCRELTSEKDSAVKYVRRKVEYCQCELWQKPAFRQPSREDEIRLKRLLARKFNILLRGSSIFDEETFSKIYLCNSTQNLHNKLPASACAVRLNRLLLEDVFPNEIVKYSGFEEWDRKFGKPLRCIELKSNEFPIRRSGNNHKENAAAGKLLFRLTRFDEEAFDARRVHELERPEAEKQSERASKYISENCRAMYGLLAGDEAWEYVSEEVAKERVKKQWGSRDFFSTVAFGRTILLVNLNNSNYEKFEARRGRAYWGENYEGRYYCLNSDIAGLEHGPLRVLENCLVSQALQQDSDNVVKRTLEEIQRFFKTAEHNTAKINFLMGKRSKLFELRMTLSKNIRDLVEVPVREISELGNMVRQELGIEAATEEIRRRLQEVDAELNVLYQKGMTDTGMKLNQSVIAFTVFTIVIALFSIALTGLSVIKDFTDYFRDILRPAAYSNFQLAFGGGILIGFIFSSVLTIMLAGILLRIKALEWLFDKISGDDKK